MESGRGIRRPGSSSRWLRAVIVAATLAWSGGARHASSLAAQVGPSPDFALKDIDGQDVTLADLKGKPLVLNFWATWCVPCEIEVPWFVEFAEKYRAQGLTVVGVSVDDSAEQIREFSKNYGVNYLMLVGTGRDDVARAFDAASGQH